MFAMVLHEKGQPLVFEEWPDPVPGPGELRVRVEACGVCRTDLHVVDGELPDPNLPVIPGHEIVGRVDALGPGIGAVSKLARESAFPGLARPAASAPIARATGKICATGRSSPATHETAATRPHAIADARFAFRLNKDANAAGLAPLLCAGLIGWRSLRFAGTQKLSVFMASAPPRISSSKPRANRGAGFLPLPARGMRRRKRLPCGSAPPGRGAPAKRRPSLSMPRSSMPRLENWCRSRSRAVRKGGIVVCAGIHMSDIPSFPYSLLWGERQIVSVANLTRQDGIGFPGLRRRSGDRDANQDLSARRGKQRLGRSAGRPARRRGGAAAASGLNASTAINARAWQQFPWRWFRPEPRRPRGANPLTRGPRRLSRHDVGRRVRGILLALGHPRHQRLDRRFEPQSREMGLAPARDLLHRGALFRP